MNVRINLLKLGALVFSSVLPFASSFAASFDDIARVINVTPNQERYVQQQQVCDSANIPVSYQGSSDRSAGGSIIGGVAGALLGNQIGGGNGRTVATAVGAIAGAMTGDRLDNRGNGYHGEPSRSCHWEKQRHQSNERVCGDLRLQRPFIYNCDALRSGPADSRFYLGFAAIVIHRYRLTPYSINSPLVGLFFFHVRGALPDREIALASFQEQSCKQIAL
ncbi:glycine zipper 2TM domain-containing protein [Undibacterium arcticum]